ncbi:Vesicular glutamate transporter 2 [Blattella germanica]|nr:Vesicular glutamate transporter 2 [Blattella germanica]
MELSGPSSSPTEKTAIKSQLSFNQDLSELPDEISSEWRFSIPRRYVVAIMAFLGFCNLYALRVNLSVAIVAMTANYSYTLENGTVKYTQDYPWSSEVQGLVLSSFFYGYIVTQIPGGWLATRIGGKKLFGLGVAISALITLLTPALAAANLYLLVLGRVVEGLAEGVVYPSIHAVWSQWAPPLERSRLATIAFSGSYFGTVVSLPLSGILAEYVGWPYIFYFFGALALVWCILWWFIVSETPQGDRKITDAEMEYIRSSIGPSANHIKVNVDPPWKRFLTSLPVWAIMIAHFSENWGFYTLLTELPTFMKGTVRKLCNCGAFVCQTLFLLAAAHSTTPTAVIASLTVAVGFGGFAWAGFSVNHLDIAPQFASILMGLSNTVATLPGMISPLLTGHLVQDKTPDEWQAVFYIAGGVYLVGAVFYGLFASGERQKWADIPDSYALCRDDQSHASTEDMPYGTGSCE